MGQVLPQVYQGINGSLFTPSSFSISLFNRHGTEASSQVCRVTSYAQAIPYLTRLVWIESLYFGVDKAQAASSQTAYKWSFASKTSRADNAALRAAREEIDSATYGRAQPSGSSSSSGRVLGPTMPSTSDLTLTREAEEEHRAADRDHRRKRERKEAKERVEDMVGPKEMGRAGQLEKKKAQRESDKAFREKGDDGLDVDYSTLMGGGDSFQAQ